MPHRETASEIDDAATTWAAKAERGLTDADRAAFDIWIEGDTRRLGAYVRAQAAWIHAERAAALGRMPEPKHVLAPETPAQPAFPSRAPNRRMILGGGAAIAASIAATYLIASNRYRTLESGIGEMRHIALEGGTALTLDTDTRVDVAGGSGDRILKLVRGKVFVGVTRSQESPLIVRTGTLMLATVEGAFSLQNLAPAPIVSLVTEGRLAVSQSRGLVEPNRTLTLEKDHALTLSLDERLQESDVRSVTPAQREQVLAWRDGMVSFGGEMLADAVRAFDRYGPARIVVVDSALARRKITGLFKANDPAGFAKAIAASLGGIVTRQGDIIRISGNNFRSV